MQHRVLIGAVVAVAALAGVAFLFWPRPVAEPPRLPVERVGALDEPTIEYPLPSVAGADAAVPLPGLGDSDNTVVEGLGNLLGAKSIEEFVLTPSVIRRIVVTIDSMAGERVPVLTRPVAATPGTFAVTREGDEIFLDSANYARYSPVVALVDQVDAGQLAALYIRLYPLMQQAYAETGDPKRYFNDRVIEVIDHLLSTPQIASPIELDQPTVFYRFKDPQLESRSAGQKLLIRMGDANAAIVKEKLSAVRAALASEPAPQPRP